LPNRGSPVPCLGQARKFQRGPQRPARPEDRDRTGSRPKPGPGTRPSERSCEPDGRRLRPDGKRRNADALVRNPGSSAAGLHRADAPHRQPMCESWRGPHLRDAERQESRPRPPTWALRCTRDTLAWPQTADYTSLVKTCANTGVSAFLTSCSNVGPQAAAPKGFRAAAQVLQAESFGVRPRMERFEIPVEGHARAFSATRNQSPQAFCVPALPLPEGKRVRGMRLAVTWGRFLVPPQVQTSWSEETAE